MNNMNKRLIILLGLFILTKGMIWTWSIPPFLAPDELPHFAYTQYLVEEKEVPKNTGTISPLTTSMSEELEMASKLMQDRHMSISFSHMVYPDDYKSIPNEFNNYSRMVNKENYKNSAAIYSPFYYAIEAIPYVLGYKLDFFSRFYLMRMFSLIFLFVTLIYSYKAALLISGEKIFATTTVIIISLMPSINSSSFGGINNDAALIAFSHILFYWLLKTLNNNNWRIIAYIGGGTLMGLTLLTKPQAVIFIPLVIGTILYKGIRENKIIKSLVFLSVTISIALAIAASFYINLITYFFKNLSGSSGHTMSVLSLNNLIPAIGHDVMGSLSLLFEFWLQVQTFTKLYPLYFYSLILALELGSIIGLFYIISDYFKKTKTNNKNFYAYLLLCAAAFLVLNLFLKIIYYKAALASQYYGFGEQGRYYFPVVEPIIILLIAGLRRFFLRFKVPINLLYTSLILFFLILHNYALINIILRYNYI